MELCELLLKYCIGRSYTPDTLTSEQRLGVLAQAEQMLVSFLVELEFVIETITDEDNSKKMFHLGYITGITANIKEEIAKEQMAIKERIITDKLKVLEDGGD